MKQVYYFQDLKFDKNKILSYMQSAEFKQTANESVSIITSKEDDKNIFEECIELNTIKNFFTKREIELFYIFVLTKIKSNSEIYTPPTFHSETSDALNSISRTFDIIIPLQADYPIFQTLISTGETYEIYDDGLAFMIPTGYDWKYHLKQGDSERFEIRIRAAEPLTYDLMKDIYTNDWS